MFKSCFMKLASAAALCTVTAFGTLSDAYSQALNISINHTAFTNSEVWGPDHNPIKSCSYDYAAVNKGSIEALYLKCKSKTIGFRPSEFNILLVNGGKVVILIPFTEDQIPKEQR